MNSNSRPENKQTPESPAQKAPLKRTPQPSIHRGGGPGALMPGEGASFCEWKGAARYFDLLGGGRVSRGAAWYYPHPASGFEQLSGRVAVYAGRVDECRVDGIPVLPQPGGFYGGWVTDDVVGPFKGEPGTMWW